MPLQIQFCWNPATLTSLFVVCDCSHATVAELSISETLYGTPYWTYLLYSPLQNNLPTPVLVGDLL